MSKPPVIGKIVEPKPSVFRDIHQEIKSLRADLDRAPIMDHLFREVCTISASTKKQAERLGAIDDQLLAFRNEHQDLIQSLQNTIWGALAVVLAAAGVISFCFAYWMH